MSKIVKIYLPAKTATQSGSGNTKLWLLEFEGCESGYKNQLMGWNASRNTSKQVVLRFHSCEEAVRYAIRNKMNYKILPHAQQVMKKKSYSKNFTT